MGQLFTALKLFIKLWPMLKEFTNLGGSNPQVKIKKQGIEIVFQKIKNADSDGKLQDQARRFNDVFRG